MRELQHAVAIEVNDSHCDSESLASPGIILSSSVGLLSSHDEARPGAHMEKYFLSQRADRLIDCDAGTSHSLRSLQNIL